MACPITPTANDYLHDEDFASCPNTVIWDHWTTKKFQNVIIPYYDDLWQSDPSPPSPDFLDLDDNDLTIFNTQSDQYNGDKVTFYNIHNWATDTDDIRYEHADGSVELLPHDPSETLFNLNKQLNKLWGYDHGVKTFPLTFIHRANGEPIDYNHPTGTFNFDGLAGEEEDPPAVIPDPFTDIGYGFNWKNGFDFDIDDTTKQWLLDMVQPGQALTIRFRADDEDFDLEHLSRLFGLTAFFEDAGKQLLVVYCAKVRLTEDDIDDGLTQEGLAAREFSNIQYALNNGAKIICVEFGNEVYSLSQTNFDFDLYKSWFEPLLDLITPAYPDLMCSVFLAPRPDESGVIGGSNEDSDFNNAAIAYINANPQLTASVHIYFSSNYEVPILDTPPAPFVYDPDTDYPTLTAFYTDLYQQTLENFNLWELTLDYMAAAMPNKKFNITEWGYNNYGAVKNTFETGTMAWLVWNTFCKDSRINTSLQHNGLSNGSAGMITPAGARDLNPDNFEYMRRNDYWTYKMFREISNTPRAQLPLSLELSATGIYRYWYVQLTEFFDLDVQNIIAQTDRIIQAEKMYSSSGATDWMDAGSEASYILDGIDNHGNGSPLRYGYIEYELFQEPQSIPQEDDEEEEQSGNVTVTGCDCIITQIKIKCDVEKRIATLGCRKQKYAAMGKPTKKITDQLTVLWNLLTLLCWSSCDESLNCDTLECIRCRLLSLK